VSGAGFPDALIVEHDPKYTSTLFRAFVKGIMMGSSLIVSSENHKSANAKVELANGVIGDTLRAFANGRKDDWDRQFAEFAIDNVCLTLGGGLTPFFTDRERVPASHSPPQSARHADEAPARYAGRMREAGATVRALLVEAQVACKAKLDAGRVDTVFTVGDQVMLRTKELLDAADIGKLRPRWDGPLTALPCPSRTRTPSRCHAQRGEAPLPTWTGSGRTSPGPTRHPPPWPGLPRGGRTRGGAAPQPPG
jgi:hypothetical protein